MRKCVQNPSQKRVIGFKFQLQQVDIFISDKPLPVGVLDLIALELRIDTKIQGFKVRSFKAKFRYNIFNLLCVLAGMAQSIAIYSLWSPSSVIVIRVISGCTLT